MIEARDPLGIVRIRQGKTYGRDNSIVRIPPLPSLPVLRATCRKLPKVLIARAQPPADEAAAGLERSRANATIRRQTATSHTRRGLAIEKRGDRERTGCCWETKPGEQYAD